MTTVRGCDFPDDLFYDVPTHTWYQPADEGLVRFGITRVGLALAREVLVFTPKRVGYDVEKGRSVATMESAKWVGSVRIAFDGTVAAVNEALIGRPLIVNEDCYGAGWMLLVRPVSASWRDALIPGTALAEAYEAWMEREAFPGCGPDGQMAAFF